MSRHPKAPVIAAEMLFDHTLSPGRTHLMEYAFTIEGGGGEALDYRRAFRYPVGSYVLSVRFTEPRPQVRCFEFAQHGAETPLARGNELSLSPGRLAHLTATNLQRGVLGISWQWT